MPCGGIYPVSGDLEDKEIDTCLCCGKSLAHAEPGYAVLEWDCFIHKDCLDDFLKTPEGEVILKHKHEIIRH